MERSKRNTNIHKVVPENFIEKVNLNEKENHQENTERDVKNQEIPSYDKKIFTLGKINTLEPHYNN